ncbi:tetratricopeptide repeat protein [Pseudonocardia acaciae]|uniref:tetratricopeptide repeat protein n=1 Tax=Pseudonocardia acaciae TaxID=551276 RepID=UPI000A9A509B|nr:tetratricopeptide repeat protein [Pseudonocardia acaciae]
MSVRWLVATGVVGLAFALTWAIGEGAYDLGQTAALEIAAVTAAAIGLPLSWWSFRGQLLDEPAEVGWVTWRRVPSNPALALPRQAEQARMDEIFRGYQGKGSPVVVITGPSGAGKTQLAAGYARARIAEGWPLVAWINAGSQEETFAGLLEFADALSMRVPEESGSRAVERLRQHPPTGKQPNVMVFDGVVDVDAVRPFLPAIPGWRVIVTSRASSAAALGTELAIELPAAKDLADRTELTEAACETLGRLPFAAELAEATLREQQGGLDAYLERLRTVAVGELLGDGTDGSRHEERYPAGAAEAVLVALRGAGFDSDPAVRKLLGLLAVLAPGGASRGLLYQAGDPGAEYTITRLTRWSLLSTRMDGDCVLMHELTRRVVLDRLRTDDALPQAIAQAADLLGHATFGEDQAWERRGEGDQLIAHIAALSTNAGSVSATLPVETSERVLGLRQWATRQLSAVGDGARAVDLAEAIRTECETLLGPEHPDSLAASDNLVIAYVAARRSREGIPLAESVLATRERVLGADHLDTLASRYTVAYAHEYAGQLDDAVTLYDRAYAEYARVLGADNPQTLTVGAALTRVRQLQPVGRHRAAQRPAPTQSADTPE